MGSIAAARAAEASIKSIGLGYDVNVDLRIKCCKGGNSRLISMDEEVVQDLGIPGGIVIPNVPKSINCDKGERTRFRSDILSFQQMSEQFNQELSFSSKIPSGYFNTTFEFTNSWQKDAASTKTLAFDGVLITIFTIALHKTQVTLCDHVKEAVPSSWDPAALARFIETYGTHVIVGVKMGGKDVIYVKQQYSSPLQPSDVQKQLKDMADKRFSDAPPSSSMNHHKDKFEDAEPTNFPDPRTSSYTHKEVQDTIFMCKRKGGSGNKKLPHYKWCQTVQSEPDVISMSLVPISSLLSGVNGNGFLTHAINLYIRCKPPIEELQQFLEFQLPRQWAPVFGDLALGPLKKEQGGASLQFSLMGPKLYVNTTLVDVGKRPVTGLRLYLEGKRSNCLAIHLQHLSSLPLTFQLEEKQTRKSSGSSDDRRYYEKVQWKSFSHINTAPVESDDELAIVTGAHFEVGESGMNKVLFLRLNFSKVVGATRVKSSQWDNSHALTQKSGILSSMMSTRFSTTQKAAPPNPGDVIINSALYPTGPPVASHTTKLLRFVDTTEITRGPQDSPGYWMVSGARLVVEKSKISLSVKYSLLAVLAPDEDE